MNYIAIGFLIAAAIFMIWAVSMIGVEVIDVIGSGTGPYCAGMDPQWLGRCK